MKRQIYLLIFLMLFSNQVFSQSNIKGMSRAIYFKNIDNTLHYRIKNDVDSVFASIYLPDNFDYNKNILFMQGDKENDWLIDKYKATRKNKAHAKYYKMKNTGHCFPPDYYFVINEWIQKIIK